SEADEPHATFIENALAKARHAAHHAGGAAIADDSGLCVDALGSAPGVISAHFAAIDLPGATDATRAAGAARETQRALQDAANNALLIERLHGALDRRARFVSTLVAVRSADDPEPLVAVGRWFGEILSSPRGMGGFGYDPLMYIAALGCTVAELSAQVKNVHSHRAIAAERMLQLIREAWRLG
ncbi:MAG TPA: non-canonical purine NTP pyrophosphatase, partial [Burkholderiaceae bacterium]